MARLSAIFLYLSLFVTVLVASPVPASPVPASPVPASPVPTSTAAASADQGSCPARPKNPPPDNGTPLTYPPAGTASSAVSPANDGGPASSSTPTPVKAAKPAKVSSSAPMPVKAAKPAKASSSAPTPVKAAKPAKALERRITCPTDSITARRMFKTRPRPNKSLFYANVGAQKAVEAAAKKFDMDILVNMLHPEYKAYETECRAKGFWVYLSMAMAEASVGDVYVALNGQGFAGDGMSASTFQPKQGGPSVGDPTIWELYEWPTLTRNKQVARIWRTTLSSPNAMTCGIWNAATQTTFIPVSRSRPY